MRKTNTGDYWLFVDVWAPAPPVVFWPLPDCDFPPELDIDCGTCMCPIIYLNCVGGTVLIGGKCVIHYAPCECVVIEFSPVCGTVLIGGFSPRKGGRFKAPGTVLIGGFAIPPMPPLKTPAGTILIGGFPTPTIFKPISILGGLLIGGFLTPAKFSPSIVGGIVLIGGFKMPAKGYPATPAGTVLIGGLSTPVFKSPTTLGGTVLIGGIAIPSLFAPVFAVGTVLVGGLADITAPPPPPGSQWYDTFISATTVFLEAHPPNIGIPPYVPYAPNSAVIIGGVPGVSPAYGEGNYSGVVSIPAAYGSVTFKWGADSYNVGLSLFTGALSAYVDGTNLTISGITLDIKPCALVVGNTYTMTCTNDGTTATATIGSVSVSCSVSGQSPNFGFLAGGVTTVIEALAVNYP